jgi:hypothetical protein
MIKEQIQDDKYHIIEISDFEHQAKKLSDKNPEIRKFLHKVQELEPRLHSRKYLQNFENSQQFTDRVQEEIKKWRNAHGGRVPTARIIELIKDRIKADFIPSFTKDKLQTENAYEIELGRQMTPDERRHLFNMNRAEQPDVPIRIIQPPPYFQEQNDRERARLEQQRLYNENLVRQGRVRAAEARHRELQEERERQRNERQDARVREGDMEAGNEDYWNNFFF